MAELSVFKSAFTCDEKPDYSLQIAQQSGLNAPCLVTHDLDPTMWEYRPDINYSFDEDRLDPSRWFLDDHSRFDFNPFSPANAESTERKHGTDASCFASQDAKVFV
jgi:hypothetical protein